MNWKKNFVQGKELVLSSSSVSGKPHSIIVISNGFFDNKLLVSDCQMKKTLVNLKNNPHIAIVNKYVLLEGSVKLFSSGKYFDACLKKSGGYTIKNAILITIKKVTNLDNQQVLFTK